MSERGCLGASSEHPRPARVRWRDGMPAQVNGEADRVAARVLAGGGPLVDRRAVASPLLGARGRARTQRDRLPRPVLWALVPAELEVGSRVIRRHPSATSSCTATRRTRSWTAPRCPRSWRGARASSGTCGAGADRPQLRLRLDGAGPGGDGCGIRAIHGAEIDVAARAGARAASATSRCSCATSAAGATSAGSSRSPTPTPARALLGASGASRGSTCRRVLDHAEGLVCLTGCAGRSVLGGPAPPTRPHRCGRAAHGPAAARGVRAGGPVRGAAAPVCPPRSRPQPRASPRSPGGWG